MVEAPIVIIQGRMSSLRLPGKTLWDINGRPSLGHLLDGVRKIFSKDLIWVATSYEEADNPIEIFCKKEGFKCHRGHLENVASRFQEILGISGAQSFFRLCGDSPLFCPEILVNLLEFRRKVGDPKLVSTIPGRTWPSGMNCELLNSRFFLDGYRKFKDKSQYVEHVTNYFYEFLSSDVVTLVQGEKQYRRIKFSLDTELDLKRIEKVFAQMTKPHHEYSFIEKCALMSNE